MNIDDINRWEEGCSSPDQPLFHEGGRAFTVPIIAEEMRSETDLGKNLFVGMTPYILTDSRNAMRGAIIPIDRGQA